MINYLIAFVVALATISGLVLVIDKWQVYLKGLSFDKRERVVQKAWHTFWFVVLSGVLTLLIQPVIESILHG